MAQGSSLFVCSAQVLAIMTSLQHRLTTELMQHCQPGVAGDAGQPLHGQPWPTIAKLNPMIEPYHSQQPTGKTWPTTANHMMANAAASRCWRSLVAPLAMAGHGWPSWLAMAGHGWLTVCKLLLATLVAIASDASMKCYAASHRERPERVY